MHRLYCIILAVHFTGAALLASQARDRGYTVFVYPKDVISERDLAQCPEHTACSVLYRRYWLPPLLERHCRCPAPGECGWSWSYQPDNRTLALDNRTQLKFCRSIKTLHRCNSEEPALTLDENTFHHTRSKPQSTRPKPIRVSDPRAVTAQCFCSEPNHWQRTNSTTLTCSRLDTCSESDICGYVRTDLFSTSYRCSCPVGQQCITQDKTTHAHQLVLYSGPVYTAHCSRVN